MAQNTKKNRGTNWTPEEKEYLFSILAPQLLAIIEKRKTIQMQTSEKVLHGNQFMKVLFQNMEFTICSLFPILLRPLAQSQIMSPSSGKWEAVKLLSENAFAREH